MINGKHNKNNSNNNSNGNNWIFFKELYEFVSKHFFKAFGFLTGTTIIIITTTDSIRYWFTGGLAIVMLLLFVFERIRVHNFYGRRFRLFLNIILFLLMIFCLLLGVKNSMPPTNPAKSSQVNSQNVNPEHILTVESDSLKTSKTKELEKPKKKKIQPKKNEEQKIDADGQKMQPLIGNLIVSYKQIPSNDSESPYCIQATVQTSVDINNAKIIVFCDSQLSHATFDIVGVGPMGQRIEYRPTNNYMFSFANPPFTPSTPIIVTLYAKQPFKVLGASFKP